MKLLLMHHLKQVAAFFFSKGLDHLRITKAQAAAAFFVLVVSIPCLALDRTAFTITRYNLTVHIDRPSQVMAVEGQLSLRNDSNVPQKTAALQVSSSLGWNSIAADGNLVQWLGEEYTSDIDHTGKVSEAIVTLPREIKPGEAISLDVQYGGTVAQSAFRLTRMGFPEDVAAQNDWDQISDGFTAIRGLGYVVWYPVAIDAVSLSDGNTVFDAIAAWKKRHAKTAFEVRIAVADVDPSHAPTVVLNIPGADHGKLVRTAPDDSNTTGTDYSVIASGKLAVLGELVPTFAVASYTELRRPTVSLWYTAEHTSLARNYALAAETNDVVLNEWLKQPAETPVVVELAEPAAIPYQSGAILFTPFRKAAIPDLQLALAPVQVAARFQSRYNWLAEGTQRFLQAVMLEQRSGRKTAVQFLQQYRAPLVQAEEATRKKGADAAGGVAAASPADNTLLNTNDELYLRGKSGFVLYMLRDMVGEEKLQSVMASYSAEIDKQPAGFQHLVEQHSKQDLEWFFDDWVYRDRGLPEFYVESAYPRTLLGGNVNTYLVTVTIENRGNAGAEVPVLIQTPSGEKTVRVLVKAGEKGVGRIEVPVAPDQVTVNDGSVLERNSGNNVYKVSKPSGS